MAYIETRIAAISAANRQSGGEDGCYREKNRNFVAWAEPDLKTAFFVFLGYPSTIQRTVYRKQSLPPNQWYRWKTETLKVCLLLVWRVCDQAFGRYRLLKGAEKWSRDHYEN